MVKKIFRASIYIFLFIFIAFSALLIGVSASQAAQIGSQGGDNNSIGIVRLDSSGSIDGLRTNAETDLGDDQAFPFIPGFGKNSGKD